jgi:uncharacterized membrane protein
MNTPSKAALYFSLAIMFNFGAVLLLEPWMILETVEASKMSLRQFGGYTLLGGTVLANIATAIQFCRVRSGQFSGLGMVRKIAWVAAGLMLATALSFISYIASSFGAQLLVNL